jgi:hypothetical protein
LRNRFYIGEVVFKGEVLKGEQEAILDRDLFEAVQAKLDEQTTNDIGRRANSKALLTGRIFDDAGNRMSPTHARKGGIRYRYYLSFALLNGIAERAGSVARVPAAEIEAVVIRSVREHLKLKPALDDNTLIEAHVARVEVHSDRLIAQLTQAETKQTTQSDNIFPFHGRKLYRPDAERSLSPKVQIPSTHAVSVQRIERPWSRRSHADAAGSMSSSPMQRRLRKVSPNVRDAVSAK